MRVPYESINRKIADACPQLGELGVPSASGPVLDATAILRQPRSGCQFVAPASGTEAWNFQSQCVQAGEGIRDWDLRQGRVSRGSIVQLLACRRPFRTTNWSVGRPHVHYDPCGSLFAKPSVAVTHQVCCRMHIPNLRFECIASSEDSLGGYSANDSSFSHRRGALFAGSLLRGSREYAHADCHRESESKTSG
jgi:hypothetical protein